MNVTPDLDEILLGLTCGINMIDAIHTAMEEGGNDPSGYFDALYGAFRYLDERKSELANYITNKSVARRQGGAS